jgi:hypothetical protein
MIWQQCWRNTRIVSCTMKSETTVSSWQTRDGLWITHFVHTAPRILVGAKP